MPDPIAPDFQSGDWKIRKNQTSARLVVVPHGIPEVGHTGFLREARAWLHADREVRAGIPKPELGNEYKRNFVE